MGRDCLFNQRRVACAEVRFNTASLLRFLITIESVIDDNYQYFNRLFNARSEKEQLLMKSACDFQNRFLKRKAPATKASVREHWSNNT